MLTTNEHGGVVEDDEEDPDAGRSLYQKIQDSTRLCQCLPCVRPNRRENENDDLEEEQVLLRNGKIKRKVIPNTNQDTWLKYIVMNLGEMDDIVWVQELASIIETNTERYNAGKFRGDVFYMKFMQREQEKMEKSRSRSKMDFSIQRS